ncbi:MAG TPA: 3'(2'),5'-bisphosphate nucleotidase CysQ [Albitalea sp.]|nr:3'(2'),5'-bisphosphate nucleotidase CysQ [Albitalea sp.]
MDPMPSRLDLIEALRPLVRRAGEAVMQVYAQAIAVRAKPDESPVTDADERAEALIVEGLSRLAPRIPIVAEEAVAAGRLPALGERFWLVDPLDGTREFIARNGEFTVNIALVEHGRPVLGVVLAPALGQLFDGVAGGPATLTDHAGRRDIRCRPAPPQGLTVLASRSHGDAAALQRFLAGQHVAALRHVGSSLKLCLIAAGQADLCPRFGRTMEWDTAAGHAVLAAAGGRVTDLSGAELRYGKRGLENPDFVARGLG